MSAPEVLIGTALIHKITKLLCIYTDPRMQLIIKLIINYSIIIIKLNTPLLFSLCPLQLKR